MKAIKSFVCGYTTVSANFMRARVSIVNIIALTISLLVFGINILYLIQYLSSKDISIAYGYGYLILNILLPGILIGFLLIPVTNWKLPKNKTRYISFLILNILLVSILVWYYRTDANKIAVTINNMSNLTMENIRITARNNQDIRIEKISPGQLTKVYCDCRDVDLPKDTGIKLKYRIDQSEIEDFIVGPHSNLFDQELEVRIINDSIQYRSYHYSSNILWGRVGQHSSLLEWEKIK